MTTTLTKPAKPTGRAVKAPIGIRHGAIEGGFLKFSAHQLILMVWLFTEGHISRRQWRICFALYEMRERRRHATEGRKPCYLTDELVNLIGGEGTGITADLKHLTRIGLVSFTERQIELAVSVDQITLDDVSGFWTMYEKIPNRKRPIPMPRRTLRALARGFGRGVMLTMIAMLIRSLFWHQEHGTHRLDGRVKRSWIADVFGITPRAVTTAMNHLTEIGWMNRIECNQFELNKWGSRFAINPGWMPVDNSMDTSVDEHEPSVGEGGKTSPPQPQKTTESSPPYNQTPFPNGKDIKTRHPVLEPPAQPGTSGVSNFKNSKNNRPQAGRDRRKGKIPRLTDVRAEDLRSTERLMMLYEQAAGQGVIPDCDAGRLDFVALAERARNEGSDPPAMFVWLLRNKRFNHITQAQEDAARQRLRSLFEDPQENRRQGDEARMRKQKALRLSDDERFVQGCLQAAKQTRFEPFRIAQEAKGWSRQQWDEALEAYNNRQFRRYAGDEVDRVFDGKDRVICAEQRNRDILKTGSTNGRGLDGLVGNRRR